MIFAAYHKAHISSWLLGFLIQLVLGQFLWPDWAWLGLMGLWQNSSHTSRHINRQSPDKTLTTVSESPSKMALRNPNSSMNIIALLVYLRCEVWVEIQLTRVFNGSFFFFLFLFLMGILFTSIFKKSNIFMKLYVPRH